MKFTSFSQFLTIVLLNLLNYCNTDIVIDINKFISFSNPCKNTLIFAISNPKLELNWPITTPVILQNNFTQGVQVIPWHRELLDQDIFHSYAFGTNRFTSNCAITTVYGNFTNIAFSLLLKKFVRRNIDFFVQIIQNNQDKDPRENNIRKNFRYHSYYVLETSKFQQTGCLIDEPICKKILQNRPVQVACTNVPERIRFQKDRNGNLIGAYGPYYKMIQLAQKLYNISHVELTEGSGGGSAGIKRNGKWIGALGDVFDERADIAVVIGAIFSRHRIADFTSSMDRYTRVFYVSPGTFGIRWTAIFRPYSAFIWGLILITVIITTIFLYEFAKKDYNLTLVFLLGALLKILFEQPTIVLRSQRNILMFSWLTFCFLVGNGYRSQLVSFLTQPEPLEIVPRTHKQLAKASNYKVYFRYYGGAAYIYTSNSNSSIHKTLTPRIQLVNSSAECIIRALSDFNSACMDYFQSGDSAMYANASLYFTANPTNILYRSLDKDLSIAMVWAFGKGSPIIQEFSNIISHSMSSGLHDYYTEKDQLEMKIQGVKWLSAKSSNSTLKHLLKLAYDANISPGLNLTSLQGLMYLLIFGLGFGFIIFVIEVIVSNSKGFKYKN